MAHGRQEFALVGYSADLEKMPLKFVEPIPASRICSACGNIPRLTYTLVCGHTFCKACYQSCATASQCVCPLDRDVCDRDDVTRKEYPVEQLLRRKVHCWNEVNGCGAILPAYQVAEHVRHDCQHHVTRCPTCCAVVLSLDMCAHLESRCTALVLYAAPEVQSRTEGNESAQFMAFEKKVEQTAHQLGAKLAQLSLEVASQSDKLVSLCHNHDSLKETLTEQILTASAQTIHRLDRNKAEVKAVVEHEKAIEERLGELDAKLGQLSQKCGCQSATLDEVGYTVNNLKELLIKEFRLACSEMKSFHSEQHESLMTASVETLDGLRQTQAVVRPLVTRRKTTQQRCGELDAKLAQLPPENLSQTEKRTEGCQNDNSTKEALTKQLRPALGRNAAEVKALCSEKSKCLKTSVTSVLMPVPSDRKRDQQVVTGYAALKAKAVKFGWSWSTSDKVYLRRYLLSWGIYFENDGESVYIGLRVEMHEGEDDDVLEWPFRKELKLSIIHPEARYERSLFERPNASVVGRKLLCRRFGVSNDAVYFCKSRVDSHEIEVLGYVENDQLLARLDVAF